MKEESNQTTKVTQFQIEIWLQQVQWLLKKNSLVGIQKYPQTSRIEQFLQSIFCRKSFYTPPPHDS